MTPLQQILAAYRATSQTEREKGTCFEELIRTYFRFEASYADLYSDVWLFADWAKAHGFPAVKTFTDFMAFSKAGRELAHWHLNYETVECHPGVVVQVGKEEGPYCPSSSAKANAEEATVRSLLLKPDAFRVTKMKFAKTKDPDTGKSINDKTTVIFNDFITLKNIPLQAYDYIVNGKPALEWVMERQSVTTDKDSGITNDANLWATGTMGNAKYPLELFLRVVTVSLETMKVVEGLPTLEI